MDSPGRIDCLTISGGVCLGAGDGMHPILYPQTKSRRGKGGKREDLGGLYVRSAWEANYARYLTWLVSLGEIHSWYYEPETFEFPVKRGSRFYTPDFRVINKNGTVEYHEVKGYLDQAGATKLKRMALYYPNVKVILIEKAAYYAIANRVARLVPYWEKRR